MLRAKGTMILGRPCRTEMVKANRKRRFHSSLNLLITDACLHRPRHFRHLQPPWR